MKQRILILIALTFVLFQGWALPVDSLTTEPVSVHKLNDSVTGPVGVNTGSFLVSDLITPGKTTETRASSYASVFIIYPENEKVTFSNVLVNKSETSRFTLQFKYGYFQIEIVNASGKDSDIDKNMYTLSTDHVHTRSLFFHTEDITLTYKPTTVGTHKVKVIIKEVNNFTNNPATCTLTVVGSTINVSPKSLDIGNVALNYSGSKTFRVKGTGPLTLSSSNSKFTVRPSTISESEAKKGATVVVTFSPGTTQGHQNAMISINYNGIEKAKVSVGGTGVVPKITTSKTDLNFSAPNTSKTFRVYGHDLQSSLSLSASTGYTVNPRTIGASTANASTGVEVTVTCTSSKAKEGKVTISGGGAATKYVYLHYSPDGILNTQMTEPDEKPKWSNEANVYGDGIDCISMDNTWDNTTTGIEEVVNDARIYAEGQSIVIESPVEQRAVISDIAGHAQTINLQVGRNEIPVNASGMYIVRLREKTAKLMLK